MDNSNNILMFYAIFVIIWPSARLPVIYLETLTIFLHVSGIEKEITGLQSEVCWILLLILHVQAY